MSPYCAGLKNGNVWTPEGILKNRSLSFKKSKISAIRTGSLNQKTSALIPDCRDHFILPGLIDLHVNGTGQCDLSRDPERSFSLFSKEMAKRGVTACLPTLISARIPSLTKTLIRLNSLSWDALPGARPLGLHLEGPFISPRRRGAHSRSALETLNKQKCRQLLNAAGGRIKIITYAPELDRRFEVFSYLKKRGVLPSMGHSDATYEEGEEAIQKGFRYAAHLFNAMPAWHHRAPGLAGAVLDSPSVYAELICDGRHVAYPVMEQTLRLKGADKVIAVSDEWVGFSHQTDKNWMVRCGGLYDRNKKSLVGSAQSLLKSLGEWAHQRKRDWTELVPLATINPAKALGIWRQCGSLETGKRADCIILSRDLKLRMTLVGGKVAYCHPSWRSKLI